MYSILSTSFIQIQQGCARILNIDCVGVVINDEEAKFSFSVD